MKRIIVKSIIRDIKSTASVPKNRSEMINNSPNTELASSYQANVKAEILHPKNFDLSVVKTTELENCIIVELTSAEGKKDYWFKEGQFLTVKFRSGDVDLIASLPVASSPGESRIVAFITPASGVEVYNSFKNKEVVNLTGVSFEGNFNYSVLRDGKEVCIITDIHAVASVISLVKSSHNLHKDTKFRIIYISEQESAPFLSEIQNIENISVECLTEITDFSVSDGCSVFIHGSDDFCGKVSEKITEQKSLLKNIRIHPIGKIKEFQSDKQHNCKVLFRGKEIEILCREGEKLTAAFERGKIPVNVRCSNGECGYCRSKLISGEVRSLMPENERRTAADIKYGYIHPCSVTAVSDLIIEI